MLLFEMMVMKEAQNYEGALGHMAAFKTCITDDLYLSETKGKLNKMLIYLSVNLINSPSVHVF